MQVRDVMKSPVITVRTGTTLAEVARLLEEKNISGVPVVDAEDRLVGIVSEYDLINQSQKLQVKRSLNALGWISPYTSIEDIAAFTRGLCTVGETTVEEVMMKNVITAKEDDSLEDVAKTMAKKRINRVPIVKQGRVVGIVTRGDVIWAMSNLCDAKPGLLG